MSTFFLCVCARLLEKHDHNKASNGENNLLLHNSPLQIQEMQGYKRQALWLCVKY